MTMQHTMTTCGLLWPCQLWLQKQQPYLLPWSQEWLRLLLARLVAVASGEYTPLALRHGDPPLLY